MAKQFYGSAPVFFVSDLLRSVKFYVDVLGFGQPNLWGHPPAFAMPERDGYIVMLSRQDDHSLIQPKATIWDAYFWVNNVESLYEEYKSKGAKFSQELIKKEGYGNLEFILEDPDGYTLAFGEEME